MLFHFVKLLLCVTVIRARTERFEHSAPMRFADALAIAKVDVENSNERGRLSTQVRVRVRTPLILLSCHHLTCDHSMSTEDRTVAQKVLQNNKDHQYALKVYTERLEAELQTVDKFLVRFVSLRVFSSAHIHRHLQMWKMKPKRTISLKVKARFKSQAQ